jgi:CBS domain-containing protein
MTAKDIMTLSPACCTRDTLLSNAAKMMKEHDCGCIPIVEGDKRVIGVITDRDIVCRCIADSKNPLDMKCGDCMTPHAVTVDENADLQYVARAMQQNQIRRVPVVDAEGRCVGIIAQADLALCGPESVVAEVVREVSKPAAAVAAR